MKKMSKTILKITAITTLAGLASAASAAYFLLPVDCILFR